LHASYRPTCSPSEQSTSDWLRRPESHPWSAERFPSSSTDSGFSWAVVLFAGASSVCAATPSTLPAPSTTALPSGSPTLTTTIVTRSSETTVRRCARATRTSLDERIKLLSFPT
jgi:hypothetical protein